MQFPYSTDLGSGALFEDPGEEFLSQYVQALPQEQLLAEGFNLLNPMTWFTRKAQAAIQEADKCGAKKYETDTLSGKLLERRRALAELQNKY